MIVCKSVVELHEWIDEYASESSLGFIPTMGALHDGHASLLAHSTEENDLSVMSIYVNPTQFNNNSDLEKYPRDLDSDLKFLEGKNCDMVFTPSVEDIYPNGPSLIDFDLHSLDRHMEGEHRPGHFAGVVAVVDRFFELIQPDHAYFGEKDFQQLAIVRYLAQERHPDTRIVGCKTARNPDGLALSSRNSRLSEQELDEAALIFETMEACSSKKGNMNVDALRSWVRRKINQSEMLDVEYVSIIDPVSLEELDDLGEEQEARICVAVWCGEVRLIDNMRL